MTGYSDFEIVSLCTDDLGVYLSRMRDFAAIEPLE